MSKEHGGKSVKITNNRIKDAFKLWAKEQGKDAWLDGITKEGYNRLDNEKSSLFGYIIREENTYRIYAKNTLLFRIDGNIRLSDLCNLVQKALPTLSVQENRMLCAKMDELKNNLNIVPNTDWMYDSMGEDDYVFDAKYDWEMHIESGSFGWGTYFSYAKECADNNNFSAPDKDAIVYINAKEISDKEKKLYKLAYILVKYYNLRAEEYVGGIPTLELCDCVQSMSELRYYFEHWGVHTFSDKAERDERKKAEADEKEFDAETERLCKVHNGDDIEKRAKRIRPYYSRIGYTFGQYVYGDDIEEENILRTICDKTNEDGERVRFCIIEPDEEDRERVQERIADAAIDDDNAGGTNSSAGIPNEVEDAAEENREEVELPRYLGVTEVVTSVELDDEFLGSEQAADEVSEEICLTLREEEDGDDWIDPFEEAETEEEKLERIRFDESAWDEVPYGSVWCPITEEWIYYRLGEDPMDCWRDGNGDWWTLDENGTEYNWSLEQEALSMNGVDELGMWYDFELHCWYHPDWIDDGEEEDDDPSPEPLDDDAPIHYMPDDWMPEEKPRARWWMVVVGILVGFFLGFFLAGASLDTEAVEPVDVSSSVSSAYDFLYDTFAEDDESVDGAIYVCNNIPDRVLKVAQGVGDAVHESTQESILAEFELNYYLDIATDIIEGVYGNGQARWDNMSAAGFSETEIYNAQAVVDYLYNLYM